MNIAIWALQIIAGLAFIMAGFMKVTQPIPTLAKTMTWVNSFSPPFVRFIGAAEFLGGVGLILPAATGILPWLTIVAAAGLAIVMAGAVIYHLQRNELSLVTPSAVLLVLSVLVLVGRWVVEPF
ncbi:MAG: DoxX family protein [Chloroflexi bacterium]|nr:DoxX family protein [Chloroflexota bacterium]OJV99729.1 MAG: hypothetical protein BGO39_12295 [Chloroflexi bacterium 54-19]